jgi:hypothetical protein
MARALSLGPGPQGIRKYRAAQGGSTVTKELENDQEKKETQEEKASPSSP